MSLTAVTVAFQLLWPGELLQSATVTIKVSSMGVGWGVGRAGSPVLETGGQMSTSLTAATGSSQLHCPGELLQSATVTIKVSRVGSGWGAG